ncbi:hypothetical protein CAOG_009407 [Capsaspora owczarzaki ATCC 30864]|uniref:DNA repair protein RAD16 n=2 Tax=Capsaspora owczarzaki (strain ATCC 30864) TaxID=595528 RepID=A0A0D2VIR1_CAPO3|nr:hypothetical protein CAOG_009407 [Capsaspora owczarzaki ATCC 30864]
MSDGSESDVEEETEDLLEDDSTTTASTTAPTPPTPATPSPTAATLNRRRQPRGRGGRAAGVSSTDLHPVDPNTNEVVDTHLSVLEKRYRRFLDNRHERIYLVHPELRTVWTDLDARIAKRAALVPEAAVVAPADKDGPAGPPRMAAPPTLLLRLLPFQEESLAWLLAQEASDLKGGILADEMGMGKTIQIISMLLASDKHPGHPTLIITPTVAMLQWLSELTKHTAPGTLAVHVHHKKTGRVTDAADLARFDVVLTTYALLEGDFRRSTYGSVRKAGKVIEPSVLQNVEWHRVVLDEAHCIKDRSCSTSRAAFALKSTVRWSLTGTPLQNRVGELYSLIRFMRLDPFSYYFCTQCSCKSLNWSFAGQRSCTDCGHRPMDHFCWWNSEVLKPIQRYGGFGPGRVAFEQLGRLMNLCMLRRTKLERAADLGLPPRIVVTRRDMFNEEEEDFYQSLYKESKTRFQTYVDAGTVLSNYAHVFELLTKMRQAANHPYLVKLNMAPSATTAADSMQVLVCGICHEEAEDAIVAASCRHVFCREDMHLYLSSSGVDKPQCPVCFRPLTVDMNQPTFEPPNPTGGTAARKKPSIINRMVLDRWRSSTKIEALLEELYRLRADDKSIKSIVFSQYVNFLDLVEWRLLKGGIRCVKLDGRMSPEQRDNVIKAFSTNPQITVFLVSLKVNPAE